MSPKLDFSLKAYVEYRGSKVPIAHIKNGSGIKLKNEDFSFCEIKVFEGFPKVLLGGSLWGILCRSRYGSSNIHLPLRKR